YTFPALISSTTLGSNKVEVSPKLKVHFFGFQNSPIDEWLPSLIETRK
ncbi:MAG: hypothetical protein ACI81T_003024, partial [Bacteroidia bacterium]